MELIMLFVLLCLSKSNSYGIPHTSNVYGNQTWNEAANDSKCSMIGLNLTGEVEDNIDNVTSSIILGKYQTAWIGAYAKRVWINFEGCKFGKLKNNHNKMTLTSPGDPAKSCLRYCNYGRFVLTKDTCVCYGDVFRFDSGCLAVHCIDRKYKYCGNSSFVAHNIIWHCLCRFSMENDTSHTSDEGNCLSVTYIQQQQHLNYNNHQKQQFKVVVNAKNCSHGHKPLCYDPSTKNASLNVYSSNWLQSWSQCYGNNKQFAGKATNLTGIHNGTYWVGTFAVTYKFWGRPRTDNDSCVAVSKDRTNNYLTTVALPCGTLLPALCTNSSLPTSVTTQETILSTGQDLPTLRTTETSVPGTTQGQYMTTISTNHLNEVSPSETSIPGTTQGHYMTTISTNHLNKVSPSETSVPGTTQGHYMTTISTNHLNEVSTSELQTTSIGHSVTPKTSPSTEKSTNRLSSSPSTSLVREASRNTQTHTPISVIVGSVVGTVVLLIFLVVVILWRRGVFRKTLTTRSSKNSDKSEMGNQNREDNMCMASSTPENVYNHLGEITTTGRVPVEDLYDHTGADGGTYGHLNSGKYDADSEYDHTFNHTTGDTYGHLNSSYMYRYDNDSEYDHTGRDTYGRLNEHNRQSGDDSNYDHTGNMYSHLNTGKYRDVVDDTYDHTGGLGNVYGHLNMSKPEEDNEYGHLNMS